MSRAMLRLSLLAAFVLFVTACQITVVPIPFDPVVVATINAQDSTEPTPRRDAVTIAPGETLWYEVRVPVARDLLYGEADGNGLRVRWVDRSGSTLAASRTPRWFAASVSAVAASQEEAALATADLRTRSIDIFFECFGPCAAIAPTDDRFYLEIRNLSPTLQSFDLYVYTFDANDQNDRGANDNQTAETATRFSLADGPQGGAIELVGDVDWFHYTGSTERVLRFSVRDELLGLMLQFEDGFSLEGTTAGLTTTVKPNERFRVFSTLGRAGPSDSSGYSVSLP